MPVLLSVSEPNLPFPKHTACFINLKLDTDNAACNPNTVYTITICFFKHHVQAPRLEHVSMGCRQRQVPIDLLATFPDPSDTHTMPAFVRRCSLGIASIVNASSEMRLSKTSCSISASYHARPQPSMVISDKAVLMPTVSQLHLPLCAGVACVSEGSRKVASRPAAARL